MSYPPPQWNRAEKMTLLTEAIRHSQVPPETIVAFIRQLRIQPNWGDMVLPNGRSYNQCNAAWVDMLGHGPASGPGPTGHVRAGSASRLAGPPGPMSTAAASRSFPPMTTAATAAAVASSAAAAAAAGGYGQAHGQGPRVLQPRPEGMPLTSPIEEPPRKKRGRPTKAMVEARAAAHGVYVPPTKRQNTGAQSAAGPSTASSSAPPPILARAPSVAEAAARAVMTPPPPPPPEGFQSMVQSSESSGGRRRRGRPPSGLMEPEGAAQREETVLTEPVPRRSSPSRYPNILQTMEESELSDRPSSAREARGPAR